MNDNNHSQIRLTIIGITGRMGRAVAMQARSSFTITGAIASDSSRYIGKTLSEVGISPLQTVIEGPEAIRDVASRSDAVISFTNPEAEVKNAKKLSEAGVATLIGTTGFNEEQRALLIKTLSNLPLLISPNFSLGATALLVLSRASASMLTDFDFSIVEMHHSAKKDSPSGTARQIAEAVMEKRGYNSIINGRSGISLRKQEEMEVLSVRGGGNPGLHTVIANGQYEYIRLEHQVLSRDAFAAGALHAAKWLVKKEPGVYSMEDVLGF
ncbi:MAG: 4-hydroxy-tetrahydrodipicolinate reductase [Conexivisphaerales archaeon]